MLNVELGNCNSTLNIQNLKLPLPRLQTLAFIAFRMNNKMLLLSSLNFNLYITDL